MERVTGDNVQDVIRREVSLEAHMMTDELNVYHPLSMGFKKHETILHKNQQYVNGNIHTNTVEGFFSLLKRGITGVPSMSGPRVNQGFDSRGFLSVSISGAFHNYADVFPENHRLH